MLSLYGELKNLLLAFSILFLNQLFHFEPQIGFMYLIKIVYLILEDVLLI